ncbi:TonB-dependent receptor, partial [bacterium]
MDKKVKAVIAPRRDLIGATVAAIIAGALSLPIAQSVYAADAAAASDELSEVVVTGSRIQRRDTEANSPLVTVDAAALENKSGLNVENYLNQLPAYNPASSPNVEATNSDVQISSINSVGIASISLRGFGANRSLTLIDGRRAVPTNALMVVDINSIPSSMIQRVEIISGGASATYGADAIGGVSNFMLRRNFQGLELDAQWGQTEVGDNQETRFSAIMGSSIGDGRGNLVFASEYYERKAALDKNRDFYTAG